MRSTPGDFRPSLIFIDLEPLQNSTLDVPANLDMGGSESKG
jgi:hypothetical protein